MGIHRDRDIKLLTNEFDLGTPKKWHSEETDVV